MKKKVMRLLVLGDQKVGKTSLISAIMYDTEGQRPKKLNKVSLSPERCIYSKDIFTDLIDTDQQSDINQQIMLCDIILLVYDVIQQTTISRIQTHWLPIISTIRPNVPIILVGNKLDKKQLEISKQHEYTNIKNIIKSLVKKYRQIQMGFQCSAYYDRNVRKVLNCAQRAVLYPLAPLYDLNTKQLTPKFKKAIKRIFRILDKDLDGKITDSQLRNLQERVFQTDLNGDDIKAIKQIILKQLQDFNEEFIKLQGFYALQKKCIQILKIQVCWSILRYFNYNDDLQINHTNQQFILDQANGQTLELSPNALNFLQRIYTFSLNNKSQSQTIMEYLFSSSPCIPLKEFSNQEILGDSANNIPLQKFILSWIMYSFLDYKQCYRSLLYIGYQQSLGNTFNKVRSKKSYSDLLKLKQRKMFSILIVQQKNDAYQKYLSLLFKNGIQCPKLKSQERMMHQSDNEDDNSLIRQSFFYNQENKQTKALILLKINQKHLQQFMQQNPLRTKIDLVVVFQNSSLNKNSDQQYTHFDSRYKKERHQRSSQQIINFIRQKSSAHTMIRMFSKQQCESKLFKNQNKAPALNLRTFPVQYKQQNWNSLFDQLVKTFQKLQIGYLKSKVDKLKKESQKINKIWTGVGIAGVTILGCLALKKNPLNLLKDLRG